MLALSRTLLKMTSRAMSSSAPVLFSQHGAVARVLLNRPSSLNAYNREMVELLIPQLVRYEQDSGVRLVLLEGAGDRAFCAGGDIVHLGLITRENQLHHKVKTLGKPVVVVADRVAMGGGMGLCCNSKYRVGTERSVFAMPETRIGYHPDAGGTYFLSRLGDLGMYLALTGHWVRGYEAVHLGFVTHFVSSHKLGQLKSDIVECKSETELLDCLNQHQDIEQDYKEFALKEHLLDISKAFSAASVPEIVSRLSRLQTPFSHTTLATLQKMSPLALGITHRTQLLSRERDFTGCLRLECELSDNTLLSAELKEGVRALLVDKDNNPKWEPAKIEDVTEELLDKIFNETTIKWEPLP